jgi:hypothetical protein
MLCKEKVGKKGIDNLQIPDWRWEHNNIKPGNSLHRSKVHKRTLSRATFINSVENSA